MWCGRLAERRYVRTDRHFDDQLPGVVRIVVVLNESLPNLRGGDANHGVEVHVIIRLSSEGLNPDPPDLKEVAPHREPGQLFWVIKNGIKMTGMPSFGATGVEDKELWTIAAFVRKLPNVSEPDFKAWTAAP